MPGSGRDGHLPRRRLVAAREPRSSSGGRGSSSSRSGERGSSSSRSGGRGSSSSRSGGRGSSSSRSGGRGSSSSSRSGSSSSAKSTYSLPSSHTDPSDHSWDSPGWHPRRRPSATPTMLLVEVAGSAHSCWASTSSSEKERRRSAAAAAAAARRKRLEGMKYLDELRHDSLLFPPPRHSPEDFDRIYALGIYKAGSKATRAIHSAPDPFWCDEGYNSSSTEHDDYSPLPSRWFVKSEGGISPTEPGFSIPVIDREPESTTRKDASSCGEHLHPRILFPDDDEVLQSDSVYSNISSDVLAKPQDLIKSDQTQIVKVCEIETSLLHSCEERLKDLEGRVKVLSFSSQPESGLSAEQHHSVLEPQAALVKEPDAVALPEDSLFSDAV